MAQLTKKQVLHVANISNLKLTDAEIKKLTPQLDKIIEFVGNLNEVDTNNVDPTSQTTGLTNVLREDVIKTEKGLTQDRALSGTDNTHNGLIKVPAILENRTDE
jgi:aspartyl-tRNA(Asn)/glutamyl-tRNA(Gln) amidotransferase subunit C